MRYELTDFEWTAIRPFLPNKPRGVPRVDDRRVLNGVIWILRSGAPWRDLPENYGPYTTCYNRFVRWGRPIIRSAPRERARGGHHSGRRGDGQCGGGGACLAARRAPRAAAIAAAGLAVDQGCFGRQRAATRAAPTSTLGIVGAPLVGALMRSPGGRPRGPPLSRSISNDRHLRSLFPS